MSVRPSMLAAMAFLLSGHAVAHAAEGCGGADAAACSAVDSGDEEAHMRHSLMQLKRGHGASRQGANNSGSSGDSLQCCGYPTSHGSSKQKCENGNNLNDGYEYVYNDGRGSSRAACGKSAKCWCCRRKKISYGEWLSIGARSVVDDEGNSVGEFQGDTRSCGDECDKNPKCKSFTICGDKCFFSDKKLFGDEPRHNNQYCSTYYQRMPRYAPKLESPSHGKTFTFHLYRAAPSWDFNADGSGKYPLGNNNLGSIGSILWYLHHEVIFTCDGGGFLSDSSDYDYGSRKFGIDTIQRVKITMKATTPLLDMGMNFGILKSFDSGEATGPHRNPTQSGVGTGANSVPEWEQFGFHVGCANGGAWPHPDWVDRGARLYPNWIWYSFPAACPVTNRHEADEKCKGMFPGGFCKHPTGEGNCTWTYEEDGIINIDELVGMTKKWKNRADFCRECHIEGRWSQGSGCPSKFNFWGENIFNEDGNKQRTQAALDMFEKKYPGTKHMEPPPCDVDLAKYGIDISRDVDLPETPDID